LNFHLAIETKFLNRVLKNKHRAISHGWSAPLARVLEQVELVAATSSTVLVSGETARARNWSPAPSTSAVTSGNAYL
jgi:transcriptional regulator with GAF, ATPase, and Fis domain